MTSPFNLYCHLMTTTLSEGECQIKIIIVLCITVSNIQVALT